MHKFAYKIHKYINSALEEMDVQHVSGSALAIIDPCPTYTTYTLLMGNSDAGGLRDVGRVRACSSTSTRLGS